MNELVEFLQERLYEDDEIARWASPAEWRRDGASSVEDSDGRLVIYGDGPAPTAGQADHIARHDPARVRREVEAKRRIGVMYEDACHRAENAPNADAVASARVARSTLQGVLTVMAGAYKDHPDYREEWAL